MATHRIVVTFNVFERFHLRFGAIAEAATFKQFRFVTRKQAFGVCVVVGFSGAAHALPAAIRVEQLAEFRIHILPTAIAMNQATTLSIGRTKAWRNALITKSAVIVGANCQPTICRVYKSSHVAK